MPSSVSVLAAGVVLTFGLVTLILLKVLPGSRRDVDYMVVGALATFISLGVLFVLLARTTFKDREILSKRRDSPEAQRAPTAPP